MDFPTFLTNINDALVAENGDGLAYLLRPTSPHGKALVKQFRSGQLRISLNKYRGSIQQPWDDIAIEYVLVCEHIAKKRYRDAFRGQIQLVNHFHTFFIENQGWTLPALFAVLRDLRVLAFDADADARQSGEKSEHMEEAARTIQKAFTACVNDRVSPLDRSRVWGVYYVVGLIMKCYFRIRKISLSKNILAALEVNKHIPPLSSFPRSHQVTFRYYLGMLNFLNEDFSKAEEQLTLAFYNCCHQARDNEARILTYLIPLRLMKGHLPTADLLEPFPALDTLFKPFVSAIRAGDLSAYDAALQASEQRLLDLALWLTLERGRELCLRGLFRKVWVASDHSTRIPISAFHTALHMSGVDVPMEEAECFVANMIYKGYLAGYISHEKQMLVLSKKNAVPRAADRAQPFLPT